MPLAQDTPGSPTKVFIMSINSKALALLTAVALGAGLVACERAGENRSASSQDSTSPMDQAPRQGYTGPSTTTPPSTPPSSSSPSGTMGSDTPQSPSQMDRDQTKQPGSDTTPGQTMQR